MLDDGNEWPLMKRDMFLPAWLQDVFLGYGNPQSVNPGSLANFPYKVDMRDTFVDAKHVQESFPELVSKDATAKYVLY